MFVKRFLVSLLMVFTVLNVFFVTTFAARSGEVERGYVEFEAFAPDDFTEPIEIQLTHKKEKYVLNYYLYKINNYFSNEAVPCGDYDVSVNVGERQDEFGFAYENSLLVESDNLAKPLSIIIDYASLEGDAPILESPDYSNEDEGKINILEEEKEILEKQDLTADLDKTSSQEEKSSKSPYSLLISLGFSLLLLLVVAFVMWKFKKH